MIASSLPPALLPLSIPSPSQGVWNLGPIPLRAYALCILLGIFAGYALGRRRWIARGGQPEVIGDVMMWAVISGLIGSRIYHVLTDYQKYFGEGKNPVDALKIWNGGLGVWGGVAFGLLGGWIACRRRGLPFLAAADAMAPGIALAQAIGRWGNYFNQELFGKPTDRPWGLEIAYGHRPPGYEAFETFHPTFLYESLWCLGVMALVLVADRKYTLGHGRALALYVAAYTVGRGLIEMMRIDTVNEIAGLRLNVWTSIILFVAAVAYFVVSARRHPGRETIGTAESAPESDSTDEAKADPDAGAEAEPETEAEPDADVVEAEAEPEPDDGRRG